MCGPGNSFQIPCPACGAAADQYCRNAPCNHPDDVSRYEAGVMVHCVRRNRYMTLSPLEIAVLRAIRR